MLRTSRGDVAFSGDLPFSDTSLKLQAFVIQKSADNQVFSLPAAFRELIMVIPVSTAETTTIQLSAKILSGSTFSLNGWWAGGSNGFNWNWHGATAILAIGRY